MTLYTKETNPFNMIISLTLKTIFIPTVFLVIFKLFLLVQWGGGLGGHYT